MSGDSLLSDPQAESTHWWSVGRKAILRSLMPMIVPSHPDTRILDIGGSDLSQFYQPYAHVVECVGGSEVPLLGDHHDEGFDLVSVCDVPEGVEATDELIAEAARCTKPGGVVLLLVPALHGYSQRKFRLPEVAAMLARVGLDIDYASYINCLLYPPLALYSLVRRSGASVSASTIPRFNGVMTTLFSLEAHLVRRGRLPFGTAVLAVGRKPV